MLIYLLIAHSAQLDRVPDRSGNQVKCAVGGSYWQSESNQKNGYGSTVSAYALIHNSQQVSIYAVDQHSKTIETLILQLEVQSESKSKKPVATLKSATIKTPEGYLSLNKQTDYTLQLLDWDQNEKHLEGRFSFSAAGVKGNATHIQEGYFSLRY